MRMLEISVERQQVQDLVELDELTRKDPRPLLEEIADALGDLLVSHIDAGDFPPLSQATLEIRAQRGRAGSTPLVDTSEMRGGIRNKATDEEARAWAPWPALAVQAGVTTGEESAIPGKDLPPRQFVYLSDDEEEPLFDMIEDFYFSDSLQ